MVVDGRFLHRFRLRLEDVGGGVVDVAFTTIFRILDSGGFRLLAPEERRPLDYGHLLEADSNGRYGLFVVAFRSLQ